VGHRGIKGLTQSLPVVLDVFSEGCLGGF